MGLTKKEQQVIDAVIKLVGEAYDINMLHWSRSVDTRLIEARTLLLSLKHLST